jgi:hypothetical protein
MERERSTRVLGTEAMELRAVRTKDDGAWGGHLQIAEQLSRRGFGRWEDGRHGRGGWPLRRMLTEGGQFARVVIQRSAVGVDSH